MNEHEPQANRILSTVLAGVGDGLGNNPATVAEGAKQILDAMPGQQQALLLLVCARRVLGDAAGARATLETMAEQLPKLAGIQYELGLLLGSERRHKEAIKHLSRVVELEPLHPAAWRALGNQLALDGNTEAASKAYARHIQTSVRELKLIEDAATGGDEQLTQATNMLRQCLGINPTDVTAIRMLALVRRRLGAIRESGALLERALDLMPGYVAAREAYAEVLHFQTNWAESIAQLDILLNANPLNPHWKTLKAANLVHFGDFPAAFALFETVRGELENDVSFWVNYGHALRTVGRGKDARDAYLRCIKLDPGCGIAWWSLANLKTYRFGAAEVEAMRTQLACDDLPSDVQSHIEFALGHALEDGAAYAESFEHYHRGNTLRRAHVQYSADDAAAGVVKSITTFTPEYFRARQGLGCPSPDPTFIVGMPRSGSTLIEQILSSHSSIEGTMELPVIANIVTQLKRRDPERDYREQLTDLDATPLTSLGEQYLELTRVHRRLGRPYFTDKALLNFLELGFIHSILPNAKIIDARRHPLGCCLSGYKQSFSVGMMPHTYDLSEIGGFYREYVKLMAHFDKVLPGKIHRVFHEDMIRDPEAETRRLLDYCGVPFEEKCLRFYETGRAVQTASSEQVRRPIFAPSVEPWRHYESWLGPVKDSLGDVLDLYPSVPEF